MAEFETGHTNARSHQGTVRAWAAKPSARDQSLKRYLLLLQAEDSAPAHGIKFKSVLLTKQFQSCSLMPVL